MHFGWANRIGTAHQLPATANNEPRPATKKQNRHQHQPQHPYCRMNCTERFDSRSPTATSRW